MNISITVADTQHISYATEICELMAKAAKKRGTGIARRKPSYIREKIEEGKAVVAIDKKNNQLAGFCYIESWDHEKYIANSGLIVHPHYRKIGLGKRIKKKVFELSRTRYPDAKIFGITTSMAVMNINSSMGYKPVTFSELTRDKKFWKGCKSCPNYDILTNKERKDCLCTGMLYDPNDSSHSDKTDTKSAPEAHWSKIWSKIKQLFSVNDD